jgi:DNA polymerase III epsilon subunit-like protein
MTTEKTEVIVADTETGGLDPQKNPILTLSAIKSVSGESLDIKINPPDHLEVSEEALSVTGINLQDLRENGVSEGEAARMFSEFVGGTPSLVAGCNFPFDMRFLREMYRRAGAPMPISHHCIDLQTVAFLAHEQGAIELPKSKGGVLLLNLDVVSAAFGVSRASELHDSLEDVKLTQKCIEEGVEKIKTRGISGVIPKTRLVALDVETSGLNPQKHSILRISAMRIDSGESYDVWVKPEKGTYGDKSSLQKTGIDTEKLKEEGVPLRDALVGLQKFLGGSGPHILAGCNAAFDVDFVECGCRRYGLRPPFGGKRIDLQTMAYVAHECGRIQLGHKDGVLDLRFDSIAKACGIERGKGADRNPTDVEIVRECFARCGGLLMAGGRSEGGEPLSKPDKSIRRAVRGDEGVLVGGRS